MALDEKSLDEIKAIPEEDKPKVKKPKPPKRFRVQLDNPKALLNVRSSANAGDNIIGTLKSGTIVHSHGTDGAYTKIIYKDGPAFVMTKKLVEL